MAGIIRYQGLTILWALATLFLCTVSFGGVGESHMFFPGFDKLTHCGLFFVLTVLMCNGYLRYNSTRRLTLLQVCWLIVVPVLYGATIEVLQKYIFTWRSGEWADLFSDSVGSGMAVFGILILLGAIANEKKQA